VKPPTVRLPYQRSHLPQSHCLSTRTYTSTRLTWLANDLLDQKGPEITDIVVVLTSNSNLPAALLLCCFCDGGGISTLLQRSPSAVSYRRLCRHHISQFPVGFVLIRQNKESLFARAVPGHSSKQFLAQGKT